MNLDPQKTAFLFPGQGSQAIGMGTDLAYAYPVARATLGQVDALLGFPLSMIMEDGPKESLDDTVNTQPALLAHSVAALRVFANTYPNFRPAFLAGHSMGELSALVAAGALPFEDTIILTRRRGELMKEAGEKSPGGMTAILGLDIPTVERICAEASEGDDIVQVANDNCPGQVVISGAGSALKRAIPLLKEARARKVVQLRVSIAAHSPLMSYAQESFNNAVDQARLLRPHTPIIGNVSAKPMTRVAHLEDDLKAQLTSSVRWTETIQYMAAHGIDTYVEIGTGNVLTGLVERIDRKARRITLGTPEDFEALANLQ